MSDRREMIEICGMIGMDEMTVMTVMNEGTDRLMVVNGLKKMIEIVETMTVETGVIDRTEKEQSVPIMVTVKEEIMIARIILKEIARAMIGMGSAMIGKNRGFRY